KQLSSFGEATSWQSSNQLILQDNVANLRNLIDQIQKMDDPEKGGGFENLEYQCKYIKARDAEQKLKSLLGDAASGAAAFMPTNPWMGGGMQFGPQGMQFGGPQSMPFGQPPDAGFSPRGMRGASALMAQPKSARPHYVASDEATNKVFVTGPANIIAQARDLL